MVPMSISALMDLQFANLSSESLARAVTAGHADVQPVECLAELLRRAAQGQVWKLSGAEHPIEADLPILLGVTPMNPRQIAVAVLIHRDSSGHQLETLPLLLVQALRQVATEDNDSIPTVIRARDLMSRESYSWLGYLPSARQFAILCAYRRGDGHEWLPQALARERAVLSGPVRAELASMWRHDQPLMGQPASAEPRQIPSQDPVRIACLAAAARTELHPEEYAAAIALFAQLEMIGHARVRCLTILARAAHEPRPADDVVSVLQPPLDSVVAAELVPAVEAALERIADLAVDPEIDIATRRLGACVVVLNAGHGVGESARARVEPLGAELWYRGARRS
jgi:hypothetical protein